jgi:hypothetical protein
VTWGINDINLVSVPGTVGSGRLDGDALLALEVHRVHDAVIDVLVLSEGAGLPEHGVDQRGLAVVDVRHNGDVAQIGTYGEA